METMPMSEMVPGTDAWAERVDAKGYLGERLRELGLVFGTRVRCERQAPLNDPIVYRVRGTLLAIRREDAARILVRSK